MKKIILFPLLAVLSLSACSTQSDNTQDGTAQNQEVQTNSSNSASKSNNNVSNDGESLPADFPKNIFIPANLKITSLMEDEGNINIIGEINHKLPSLHEKTQTFMKDKGWSLTTSQLENSSLVLMFNKDNHTVQYRANEEDGKVLMTLLYYP